MPYAWPSMGIGPTAMLTLIVDYRLSFWLIAGACAGVYFFYRGFRLLQRKRLIMDTPASKIRSAAMGLVEVSGLATGPYTLRAPITGVPCYYYRSAVWQWKQQGKSKEWVKVADESMHVPFFLDDNSGKVLVNPQGAELDIHRDFHEEFSQSLFGSSLDIPANVSNFLLRNGVSTDQKLKVEEYCIKPKNALFILGTLATNPGISVRPDAVPSETVHRFDLKAELPRSLVGTLASALNPMNAMSASGVTFSMVTTFTKTNGGITQVSSHSTSQNLDKGQQEKIANALMKAGITSPNAWAAAGISGAAAGTAVAPAPEVQAPASQFDMRPSTVLMKGTHDPSFFISWRSQRDVVKSLGWKSALMIWGGPALTVLCVYILAAEFGWL